MLSVLLLELARAFRWSTPSIAALAPRSRNGGAATDAAGRRYTIGLRDAHGRNSQRQWLARGRCGLWSDGYGLGEAGRPDGASPRQVNGAPIAASN
jgi:hypothetical protein